MRALEAITFWGQFETCGDGTLEFHLDRGKSNGVVVLAGAVTDVHTVRDIDPDEPANISGGWCDS